MKFFQIVAIVSTLFLSVFAQAGKLTAEGGWVRAVPPVSKNTAAYLTLKNGSKKDEVLLHLSSKAAKHTELHTIVVEPNGAKKMQKMPHATIKAGTELEMKPGGYHVMLIDLVKPLKEGDTVELEFIFQHAGKLSLSLPVKMSEDKAEGGHHHHHH
ncbi:MAG: copper chaperone PCu(A)C [Pseudomonadales bacterium]|nr:copper chaperone PCu(A)C [Pseudomonadales bacterium]